MRVAWLADPGNTDGTGIGGAELTQAEFRLATPKGVRVSMVTPNSLEMVQDCDVVCCFNVALYPEETLDAIKDKRVVRYWNDQAPHGDRQLTNWLVNNATNIFLSPLHYETFPHRNGNQVEYHLIPPAVPVERFRKAAEGVEKLPIAVALGPWRAWGKSPFLAQRWAKNKGIEIDFYGGGQVAPAGSRQLLYKDVPKILANYEWFVYLPTETEPFCRTIVEADAAGCRIVYNRKIGAIYWLQENREGLETAADRFWEVVTDD